ncbi:MAG: NUDIX domain-containing protein [Treponema sp.]|nr:NUDIX domain-containing protein [Treponema sp.]MCL2273178.1 NUDIX domain-containing protein [Treponema sp.]
MFKYCPSCASKKFTFEEGKVFRCADCGLVYFQNIAAATGCLIIVPDDEERLVLLERNKEPGKGMLDLPGGFVDIGEGVLEGLCRELKEELGWTPPIPEGAALCDIFTLFASFPNKYRYKNIDYNTCDMYFTIRAPGLKPEDLNIEEEEISGVLFKKPQEVDLSKLAFTSTRKAIEVYLNKK